MVACRNHMAYRYREFLGGQALDLPAVGSTPVDDAVMHAAVPPLPELDHGGAKQVAAPVAGSGHLGVTHLCDEIPVAPVELLTLDRAALRRDRSRDLAVARSAREVGVRVLSGELLD